MKKYILSILALAAIAFVGCEKDDIDDAGGKQISGQVINFGAGALESRTIYESTDSKQIHWQTGDKVRIYCAQAIGGVTNVENSGDAVAYADYAVTVDATDKSFATIALAEGSSPLLWGGSGIAHKFYAVYPHDAATEVAADGTVTFPINRNQICYIQTADEKNADDDASKYTYVARPDMSNAYMVASSEANPVDYVSNGTDHNNVWLDFKPIMTTINIVVKGPQNLNSDGTPDVNSTADPVVMTGVSVISTITTNTTASKSQFVYDIEKAMITGSQVGTGTASEQTETTFISPRNTDGLDAVTLEQGETLCLTAFLPPMAETTAAALSRDIKIRVHTTGGNKTMSLEDATALLPSRKGTIKLPSIYTPISGSNWITPLDDDIYVSQLSIPGTHDAATGNGFDSSFANIVEYVGVQFGQTQDIDIAAQWGMGIRCFDLRPAQYTTGSSWLGTEEKVVQNYHGIIRTNITFDDALKYVADQLANNPGEFAIVLMRHESEIDDVPIFGESQTDWGNLMDTSFSSVRTYAKTTYPTMYSDTNDLFVDFKPGLTIGECRGKILVLSRSTYTNGPVGGYVSGWSHSSNFADQKSASITGSSESGTLYVQDFYNPTETGQAAVKLSAIRTMLNFSRTLHTDANHVNTWVINHVSGYTQTAEILGIDLGISTLDGYRANSANNNPEIYKDLISETWEGSTGIVLLDFVGSRTSGTYTVYGDLLPQAIIDNNYKYRMKRKGE